MIFVAGADLLKMIVSAHTVCDISLGKAAELMGVSHEEMKDILAERGAEVHLGSRTVLIHPTPGRP